MTRAQFDEANQEYAEEGKPLLTEDDVLPFWCEEEATAYQLYETVSEGTPMGPVLPDKESFLEWLVEDQHLSRQAAEGFVEAGSLPSAVQSGDKFMIGLAIAEHLWG